MAGYTGRRYWAPRYFGRGFWGTDPRAVIVEVADAVYTALSAATLSQGFAVERSWAPVHDLKDLTDYTLSVVPAGVTSTPLDRSGRRVYDYLIGVMLQRKFPRAQNNPFDPAALLAQEVADLFRGRRLDAYPAAVCLTPENDPVHDPAAADEMGLFTSLVKLTFRVIR